jgi:hypothetical protein
MAQELARIDRRFRQCDLFLKKQRGLGEGVYELPPNKVLLQPHELKLNFCRQTGNQIRQGAAHWHSWGD